MSPHAYLVVVLVGAAVTGLWLAVRLGRFTPHRGITAAACLALAWFVLGLGGPLLSALIVRLPVGPAIFASLFPVFAASFALIAFGLRYLAELGGHAAR